MKVFKTIMNVFGIIAASFLSLLLVVVLVVTPMVSAVSSFFQGENIHKLLTSIDFSKMVTSEIKVTEEGELPQVGSEIINQLLETEMMKEIVEICVDKIFAVMDGTGEKDGITAEEIMVVAENHLDELAAILKSFIGDSIPLTEETLNEMARSVSKEYSVVIAEMMPTAEDLGIDENVLNVIMNLRNGTYFWIIFGISAGLTLIVMLCQVMRFKGFIWIGVDYLVAAVLALILSFTLKVTDIPLLLAEELMGISVLSTVSDIVSMELFKGAALLAVLGILFIVIFVMGRKHLKKKIMSIKAKFVGV